jgi:hypothetical protein
MFMPRPTTIAPSLPDPPPADRHAAARALIDRQLVMLSRLAEIGMDIAEEAGRQATAPGGDAKDGALRDPARAYAQAARAVRMTIVLQSRLLKDLADLEKAEGLARTARAGENRNRVRRLFYRAIDAGELGAAEARHLYSEAQEHLKDEDEAALADGPLDQVVARICRALGLPSDWAAEAFPTPSAPAPPFTGELSGECLTEGPLQLDTAAPWPPPSASIPFGSAILKPPLRRGGEFSP